MKTAVVILNWNGKEMLRRYLPSVVESTRGQAEVWVADNGSEDGSVEDVERRFPECRTLRLGRNHGFAGGYNEALSRISAHYYVLLNSDVETPPGWLSPLTGFLDSHPGAAACQPKLLSAADHSMFEYAGAAGGFIDKYGYPYCRGRIFGTVEKDRGQYDTVAETHWATGACLAIRSADFHGAGGFDSGFFAHNEEIDLCWRLRNAGRKIYCTPESAVYHLGGGTLPQGNPGKTFLNFRNNLAMLRKNLPGDRLRPVMAARWALDRLAALQSLAGGGTAHFRAIMRARREYASWKPQLDKQRTGEAAAPLSPFSILWQYHAMGRKFFSQLPGQ